MPASATKSACLNSILANFPEDLQKPYDKKNLIIADENVSSYFVEVLDRLAYLHKVTSVNHPFRNLGLYKGMDDGELVEVAERNGCAMIITKDLDIGRIYPKTVLLPANGHKEREIYVLESLDVVFDRLQSEGFINYEKILSAVREAESGSN